MTNAAFEQTAHTPWVFVGVDMAQQAFVWGLHGVRATHTASNDETGFQALLGALKGHRVGLVVIEATGRLGARAGQLPVATPGARGRGQPSCCT